MAARAYHKPDNVVLLPEGCCQPPPGAKLHMMLFYAKRAAKEEMKAQGIKIAYIQPREVRLRAEELLRERWEDFERLARPMLLRIASKKSRSSNKSPKVGTETNG
jgi:hypothetical protein